MEKGVVILGGGHGGSQAGFSLRQEGFEGPIALISDEADLPYHKPPLSKAFLKDPDQEPQILRAEKAYDDARIDRMLGVRVTSIDRASRRIEFASGASLPYCKLLLATGASNRRLSIPGHDLAGIFNLRTLADARVLRDAMGAATDVVVIGGGFIGLEAAATFAALGKTVTVIEMAPTILGRAVSALVAAHVDAEYRKAGIRILTRTSIERIDGENGRVGSVTLASGDVIAADLILAGIGALPNDQLARDAGLTCDNGVAVSPALQTSDENIFAIGDVASYHHWQAGRRVRLESVQNASDQAKHVAKSMLGRFSDYREVPWFWSDQGSMKLQMTGLSFDADRHLLAGDPASNAFSVYHFQGDRLLAVDSVNRPADHMLARRMLAIGFVPADSDLLQGPAHLKQLLADRVAA